MLQLLKSKLFFNLVISFSVCALLIVSARLLVRVSREIPAYALMEQQADQKVMSRVNNSLALRTEQLLETHYALSLWDELYYFAQSPNASFIDSYFSKSDFDNSVTSGFFIFDDEANPLWSFKSNELIESARNSNISEQQLDLIAAEHTLIPAFSYTSEGVAHGISSELDSPLLFLTLPIHNNKPGNNHSGFLVIWDFLDSEKLEYTQRYLQTDFAFQKIIRGDTIKALSNSDLKRDTNNMIRWSINDYQGQPAFNVHLFLEDRRFNSHWIDESLLIELIAAAVVFFVLALLVTQRIILPIRAMQQHMIKVRETRDFSNRMTAKRADELGSLSHEYNTLLEHIEQQEEALKASNNELLQLSNMDSLTGIANRRAFDDFIQNPNLEQPVSLMMIDIDHFKRYNDHYGHPQGDRALKKVAKALQGNIHIATDLAARYGGEEFAIVLTHTSSTQAYHVAQRILASISQLAIEHSQSEHLFVTVSIGLCTFNQTTPAKHLIEAADKALYNAKELGRNRVQQATIESSAD